MESMLQLLLRRGADPNASKVPMPSLFFPVKAADVDMVRLLLLKGVDANAKLSEKVRQGNSERKVTPIKP